jgi:hypothetical protein
VLPESLVRNQFPGGSEPVREVVLPLQGGRTGTTSLGTDSTGTTSTGHGGQDAAAGVFADTPGNGAPERVGIPVPRGSRRERERRERFERGLQRTCTRCGQARVVDGVCTVCGARKVPAQGTSSPLLGSRFAARDRTSGVEFPTVHPSKLGDAWCVPGGPGGTGTISYACTRCHPGRFSLRLGPGQSRPEDGGFGHCAVEATRSCSALPSSIARARRLPSPTRPRRSRCLAVERYGLLRASQRVVHINPASTRTTRLAVLFAVDGCSPTARPGVAVRGARGLLANVAPWDGRDVSLSGRFTALRPERLSQPTTPR